MVTVKLVLNGHTQKDRKLVFKTDYPLMQVKSIAECSNSGILSNSIKLPFVFKTYEPRHEISNNVVFATSKGSDQPAHTGSLIRAFASCLNILRVFSYRLNTILSF